jgi:histidinol-phosphate aminotransferase
MKTWLKDIVRVDVLPRPGGTDLRYSEWTQQLPSKLFKKFIKSLTWEDFALYPDTNILKNRIAQVNGLQPINIYLAPGSAEAIKSVFDCMNLGESVMTTDPCFPMYDVYAKQNKLHLQKIGPHKDKYILRHFLPQRLIVISRPSNPLGYFFSRKEIIELLEDNPSSWVLVDEAYIDYAEKKDNIVDLLHIYDNLIISRSFSKTFGAAGCRVGYLMSHSKNIDLISKFRQMYEVWGPAMRYAMFLLDNQEEVDSYCKKTIRERKKLCKLFKQAELEVVSSQGNWIHVQQTPSLQRILEDNNISVKTDITLPGKSGAWVRITVGPGTNSLFKELLK